MRKYTSIDEYLSNQPKEFQVTLEKLRKTIKKIVPKAEECIMYSMPAFKLEGKCFACIAGFKKHMSYFPYSGHIINHFPKELEEFKHSKGGVQFTLENPLPKSFVKKMIEKRLLEIKEKRKE